MSAQRQTFSLDEIKDKLLNQLDRVVHRYAPPATGSHTTKGRYFTLNPGRPDRHVGSFWINMNGPKAGTWADAATGDYGDVIDLIALSLECSLGDAFKEARSFLGLATLSPEDRDRQRKADEASARARDEAKARDAEERRRKSRRAQAIWLSGQAQLRDTPVEFYLRDQRGIDLRGLGRQPGVLRYLPDCFYTHVDPETGEVIEGRWPAMVAIVQNAQGQPVACHRTWLAQRPDGLWDKAPVPAPKKVLGPYSGGFISVWKGIGPRGGKPVGLTHAPHGAHVFISEGIEDALSAVDLMPSVRVLAAISLSNLGAVRLPSTVTKVTLIADLDEGGAAQAALTRAIGAHRKAGREVRLFQNRWGGKDLNDALRAARRQNEAEQTEGEVV